MLNNYKLNQGMLTSIFSMTANDKVVLTPED